MSEIQISNEIFQRVHFKVNDEQLYEFWHFLLNSFMKFGTGLSFIELLLKACSTQQKLAGNGHKWCGSSLCMALYFGW